VKEGLFTSRGGLFQESTDVIVAVIFGEWVQKMKGQLPQTLTITFVQH